MISRFETFVTTITSIYRSIQRIKNQKMASLGLKGNHVMCLYQLYKHSEGLTSTQLSRICEEDKAAISRTLTELKKRGFVYVEDTSKHRQYRTPIKLTKDGLEITKKIDEKISESIQSAAQGYSEEEREIFYRVLLRIAENLQNNTVSEEEIL